MNAPERNAVATVNIPSLAMSEQELMSVLQNSLYPGAKVESIKLVLGYCKASGLDPMQKPCHIVPISVKQGENYVMRDVVMPGIGLYRTQASRTGEYAGVTEPEFGEIKEIPIKTKRWNNAHKGDRTFTMVDEGEKIIFPEWCRITVKRRMASGEIVEFTANERWLENYATAGNDTTAPNAMWKRRPFAQLAKCAEAQALRKAFPELGAAPTADEMEGKQLDDTAAYQPPAIEQPRAKSDPQPASKEGEQPVTDAEIIEKPVAPKVAEPTDSKPLQGGQKRILAAKLKNAGLTDVDLKAVFGRTLDEDGWLFSDFEKVQKFITERSGG